MLDGGKNIDTVFKTGLSNHEVAPDAYVWESIEKSMQKQKRQAATIIMWRSVAAACVLALIAVSVVLLNSVSEPLVNQTAEVIPLDNQKAKNVIIETTIDETKSESSIELSNASSDLIASDDGKAAVLEENVSSPKASASTFNSAIDEEAIINMDYLASISTLNIGGENELNTDLHHKEEKVYFPIYNPLNAPASAKIKKKTSISIGGVLSPSYNSKMSTGGNESVMAASGVDVNESGINSLGGGLQLRVNTGSRWSFETGVLYAQVGQEVSNSYSYQPYRQAMMNSSTKDVVRVTNSLGPIVSSKAKPMNSALYSDNMVEASYNTVNAESAVKQTLDYIEVPMMARYSLIKNFPYLSIAGGFSSNFLVDNAAYAIDNGSEKKIGETGDIKSFVLSSSIGVGIDVPIIKSIHLNVEPRLKYFLNSVSSNDDYNFQPYSFGVYGGLIFVIK